MPQALIDTHCHFDFAAFDHDRSQEWQQTNALGVTDLIIPGTRRATWAQLLHLTAIQPHWHPYIGLHPYFLSEHQPEDIEALAALLDSTPEVVGIGEIGLDYFLDTLDRDTQQWYFDAQLQLAEAYEKPVILHARKAYDAVLKSLRRITLSNGGIVHAFSGSRQQAEQFISLGFKLGIGGAVTHERATRLRQTVAQLPLSAIVAETDAPDMRPACVPVGERNSPRYLVDIIAVIADVKSLPFDACAQILYDNSHIFLNPKSA